ATRVGSDDISSFAGVIIKASAMGAQVSELLAAHAVRLRETRLMELEEKAGKANAALSLPLSVCLLPSGMLLLIAPPFITLFRVL
ncbi:MAG: type II secretion system F family protein, partial [Deltaproteobacteria bacterium]|nr:type II secretion system F family protein [Deltaproteobacteria bacterium]